MSKFIQENRTLLLLIIAILVITLIIVFKPKSKKEDEIYDLSNVIILNIDEAISKWTDVEPHVYIIGRETCSASNTLMPAVNEVIDKYHVKVYYIDQTKLDRSSMQYAVFKTLLNKPYEYDNKKGTLADFLNYTPMILISSNGETIYGSVGSMTADVFEVILKEYSIIEE